MKYVAVLVFVECADTFALINVHIELRVIVNGFAALEVLRRERHIEIEVEVCFGRGKPFEPPAHALLERLDFRQWRAGDDGQRCVALAEMNVRAVEMVGPERAMRTPFLPTRTEHEMIDD